MAKFKHEQGAGFSLFAHNTSWAEGRKQAVLPNNLKCPQRKKNRAGGFELPNFRLYSKATVIKKYDTDTETDNRSMEQNTEPRSKFQQFWSMNL